MAIDKKNFLTSVVLIVFISVLSVKLESVRISWFLVFLPLWAYDTAAFITIIYTGTQLYKHRHSHLPTPNMQTALSLWWKAGFQTLSTLSQLSICLYLHLTSNETISDGGTGDGPKLIYFLIPVFILMGVLTFETLKTLMVQSGDLSASQQLNQFLSDYMVPRERRLSQRFNTNLHDHETPDQDVSQRDVSSSSLVRVRHVGRRESWSVNRVISEPDSTQGIALSMIQTPSQTAPSPLASQTTS